MGTISHKQDRGYARTVQDMERKYAFKKSFAETSKAVAETQKQVVVVDSGLRGEIGSFSSDLNALSTKVNNLSTEVDKKLDADAVETTIEQGESDRWTYLKRSNGWLECWKTFQKTVTAAEWEPWGSLYTAPLISGENLPFEFSSKREFATLHSTADVMLISNDVGTYKVCSPVSYTEDRTIQIDVYVVGMVEQENTDS